MKCICENMMESGIDMHNTTYKSADYESTNCYEMNGKWNLNENYGTWRFKFCANNHEEASIEIFYCPFCGRKLNGWRWAKERRNRNFEEHIKQRF